MGFKKKRLSKEDYIRLVFAVMERDKWRCTECKSRNNLQAHHKIFRSAGGADELGNMQTLCHACHEEKHR